MCGRESRRPDSRRTPAEGWRPSRRPPAPGACLHHGAGGHRSPRARVRARAGLAVAADPPDRALRAGRWQRHRRAHDQRAPARAAGRAGGHREP
ncbi:MAG: hypothetical protein ACK56I_01720, partial [bacterium]